MDRSDAPSVKAYIEGKEKLNTLLLQEEIYWKQRAKLLWLNEGDENTRLFHSSASARKKLNKISFLFNNEGERIEDQDGMCKIVREYFSTLFSREENNHMAENVGGHITVTTKQNNKLTEDFSFEEFTTAVKQMHPDKASRPDGLNPAFFQSFWSIME